MVRKLSRRFATNRELIRILLFIFKATTSQKVYVLEQLSCPAHRIDVERHHELPSIVTTQLLKAKKQDSFMGQTNLINLPHAPAY